MARSFGIGWSTTNTASTTIPSGHLFGTSAIMPAIYEVNAGSAATADNAVSYGIVKTTARGTQLTSTVTPVLLDENQGAAVATFDYGWSVPPTITSATAYKLFWGQHQRGTYRWVAYDYTKMLQVNPSQGLALLTVTVSGAFVAVFSIEYQE